ncbi:uncharacterized protein N0V89_004546 [Didymosphaeria variabile]|uniref:Beta-lactamase/transpeptidase-like protein n=1 Tax=Didymosphaeria variabile TaxID=1932322 RepID=A0A9W8XQK8_9PLEO|nr:uncharacterized protein N0V89_004546 [Didymosphaeria variabile]KAJ4356512.1 hypothetical protein N0V89_004546 [Didymosphaeria variabile]
MALKAFSSVILLSLVTKHVYAEDVPFSPCPLLGPRFPIPTQLSASPILQSGLKNLTDAFDDYVTSLNGTFGPTSSSTSFSVALFSTEDTDSTQPFLYEYHHTAPSFANETSGTLEVDADTVYQIGDSTTLFTTWLFLIEAGEQHWTDPVSRWVPELLDAANGTASGISVDWDDVTLGDLAAHLGGIGRYAPSNMTGEIESLLNGLTNATITAPCDSISAACERADFLSYFGRRAPVFAAGTTPIFSNAGFIILAYALESITGQPYESILESSIIQPLNLSRTTYLQPSTQNSTALTYPSQSASLNAIEGPYNGLTSSAHDMSTALRAVLASTLLPPSTTRRWLKPVSHTSNLVNSVGRPWEIYSLSDTPISPVIPVYQVRGNVGLYASHIGLVPDYNMGFVILAADSEGSPDLNAHADIIATELIPALEQSAIVEASTAYAGTYVSDSNMTLVVAQATDSSPGLSVSHFRLGDKDIRAAYAELNSIDPENLSFRLYPTNVGGDGKQMVFRASFQDVSALADAGTPTCDTWRYIDQFQLHGVSLDEFVFEIKGGKAVGVTVPAFNATLLKQGERVM